jgi:hypothetical protein
VQKGIAMSSGAEDMLASHLIGQKAKAVSDEAERWKMFSVKELGVLRRAIHSLESFDDVLPLGKAMSGQIEAEGNRRKAELAKPVQADFNREYME